MMRTTPLWIGLLAATPIAAQPIAPLIESVGIAPAPLRFQVQAQVTNAGVPVVDGRLDSVMINVLDAGEVRCTERFSNVEVRNGVLNLEYGAEIDCDLDRVIAQSGRLQLRICPSGAPPCPPAIELGSSPAAIRASGAEHAAHAHQVQQAAQAHYAHRFVADPDLAETEAVRTGYFDLESRAEPAERATWGQLRWAQMRRQRTRRLVLAAANTANETKALEVLRLDADLLTVAGRLTASTVTVTKAARVAGALVLSAAVEPQPVADADDPPPRLDVSGRLETTQLTADDVDVTAEADADGVAVQVQGEIVDQDPAAQEGAVTLAVGTLEPAALTVEAALTANQGQSTLGEVDATSLSATDASVAELSVTGHGTFAGLSVTTLTLTTLAGPQVTHLVFKPTGPDGLPGCGDGREGRVRFLDKHQTLRICADGKWAYMGGTP